MSMFKQRKAKGSLKQRKREDSDSEGDGGTHATEEAEEASSTNDIPADNNNSSKKMKRSSKNKKKSGPAMSFLDDEDVDEEGGDVATFKVKKSKLSKSIKRKMHQAPVLVDPTPRETSFSASSSSTSSASDYLSSLRAEQKYSFPTAQQSLGGGLEGMELTGEEAESMEELTESLEQKQQQGRHIGEEGGSSSSNGCDELPDYIPLRMEQNKLDQVTLQQQHLREVEGVAHSNRNAHEEQDEQDDDDWEAQLARRAGVRPPSVPATSSVGGAAQQLQADERERGARDGTTTPPRSSSSKAETEKLLSMLSYDTVKNTLRCQIASLSERTELQDSRLRTLESSLESHKAEAEALRAVSEKKHAQMGFLQHLRLFASDVCGMLREKEPLIGQLQRAVLEHLTTQASRQFEHWRRRQDQELERLRQSGDVVTLGGYLPTHQPEDSCVPSISAPSSLAADCEEISVIEKTLQATMLTFHQAADTLMQDVRPDLSSLPVVLTPFADFRRGHFKKYTDAYISLSLSQLLKHYILLDIVPLYLLDSNESEMFDVTRRPWFSALFTFSVEDTSAFSQKNQDKDNNKSKGSSGVSTIDDKTKQHQVGGTGGENDSSLLPRVVAQVVLPWFTEVVAASLNPLSITQMTTCRRIMDHFRVFDLREVDVAPVCQAVLRVTTKWLGAVCVPVIKMRAREERGEMSAQFFVRQQLDRLSLLLENLHQFAGLIATSALVQVAWTALVSQGRAATALLAGTEAEAGAELIDEEVANYEGASRLCRAVRALLPPLPSSTSRNIYDKMTIPIESVTQLSSLVFFCGDIGSGSSSSISSGGNGAFRYHRAALLRYLRQLPT